jgi:hypothetical protein
MTKTKAPFNAREQLIKAQIEAGHVVQDDYGNLQLTGPGRQRISQALAKIPVGDEFLLEMAVLDAHGLQVTV